METKNQLNPEEMSDKDLYNRCRAYGNNIKKWSRKFASLLYEVDKRRLYKKKGFYSIYEFAAKVAGMNNDTVREIFRVSTLLQDKPLLLKEFRRQGWSKLRVVAVIATPETDKLWAQRVRSLPKRSLELYIRELRNQEKKTSSTTLVTADVNGSANAETGRDRSLQKRLDDKENSAPNLLRDYSSKTIQQNLISSDTILPGEDSTIPNKTDTKTNPWTNLSFKIPPKLEFKVRKLQTQLQKERKEAVSLGEVLGFLMDNFESSSLISSAHAKGAGSRADAESSTSSKQPCLPAGGENGANEPAVIPAKLVLDSDRGERIHRRDSLSAIMDPCLRRDDGVKRRDDGVKRGDDGVKRGDDGVKRGDDGVKRRGDGVKRRGDLVTSRGGDEKSELPETKKNASRYIPKSIRKYLDRKFKGRCGFPGCNMPSTSIHHTKRFALFKEHDPEAMVPLCDEHERIVHAGLVENEHKPPGEWRIAAEPNYDDPTFEVDYKVMRQRMGVLATGRVPHVI